MHFHRSQGSVLGLRSLLLRVLRHLRGSLPHKEPFHAEHPSQPGARQVRGLSQGTGPRGPAAPGVHAQSRARRDSCGNAPAERHRRHKDHRRAGGYARLARAGGPPRACSPGKAQDGRGRACRCAANSPDRAGKHAWPVQRGHCPCARERASGRGGSRFPCRRGRARSRHGSGCGPECDPGYGRECGSGCGRSGTGGSGG